MRPPELEQEPRLLYLPFATGLQVELPVQGRRLEAPRDGVHSLCREEWTLAPRHSRGGWWLLQ